MYQPHEYMQAPVEDGKFSLLARAGKQVKALRLNSQHWSFEGYSYVSLIEVALASRAPISDHNEQLRKPVTESHPIF